MSEQSTSLSLKNVQKTISKWLSSRLPEDSYQKLEKAFKNLSGDAEDWEVFSSFSAVPRYTGKSELNLDEDEAQEAETLKPGWQPKFWTVDQLGRTWLLLAIAERDKDEFLEKLNQLFVSSDLREAVALYQALPVLPWPEELRERASEGIRTNITSVFNAVALRNPYPAEYLDDDAWNQVVLKSLFIGTPLYLIHGIDNRANRDLAHMLVEYAHERWSADRDVSPELWRPVGPFINDDNIDEIRKVLSHPDTIQKHAAVLALSDSESSDAQELLDEHKEILAKVKDKNITWDDIGRQAEAKN